MREPEARRSAPRGLTKGVGGDLRLWRDIREPEREAEALAERMDDLGVRR